MVARAGHGYIPTMRIPSTNTHPLSLSQRITTVALTILCLATLPTGWNFIVGFGVLALGFLYPLAGRVTPGIHPTYHLPAAPVYYSPPPFIPPYPHFRGPAPTHIAAGGHQIGDRRIPGGGTTFPAPPTASLHVAAGGHLAGDRRPVGGSIPGGGVASPAPVIAPTHIIAGHLVGSRRIPGGGGSSA